MERTIKISKIGPIQLKDVEHSGQEYHDEYFRTCTVLQGDPPISGIGDDVPYRIQKLYGRSIWEWNKHFIVQVAGCPLKCWYCYVDNLKPDREISIRDLVQEFSIFFLKVKYLNVFHFMGGCPGAYSYLWKDIREELDRVGLGDVVFMSDVILLENLLYGVTPWEDIPHRSIISACLKGTNFQNFKKNTGVDGFAPAAREAWKYTNNLQVYYSLLDWDPKDEGYMKNWLGNDRINWLTVKEYEVVKKRRAG